MPWPTQVLAQLGCRWGLFDPQPYKCFFLWVDISRIRGINSRKGEASGNMLFWLQKPGKFFKLWPVSIYLAAGEVSLLFLLHLLSSPSLSPTTSNLQHNSYPVSRPSKLCLLFKLFGFLLFTKGKKNQHRAADSPKGNSPLKPLPKEWPICKWDVDTFITQQTSFYRVKHLTFFFI